MSAVVELREPGARHLEALQPPLVRQFELLATAPGGVARLRELILMLAVQGKLSRRDPLTEPASALLKRILNQKEALVAAGRIKRDKPLPPIDEAELPFEIPDSWCWIRLGSVTNYGTPSKGRAIDAETWVLDLEDIEKSTGRLLHRARRSERPALSEKNSFQAGDVLYGKLRPYLNKVIVADEPGVCTTELVPFRCYGDWVPQYFKFALSSPAFLGYVNARSYGMKMPRLGTEDARRALLPLPPLEEQARIVARVDELMRLCDALEVKGRLEAEQHDGLLGSLLGTLTDSSAPEELATNWQRLANHLDLLLNRPEAVDALEAAAVKLAITGRLAPQSPQARSPMSAPAGWIVSTIGELARVVTDGTHKTPRYVDQGVKFVSAKDVRSGSLRFDECKYITREEHEQLTRRCRPERGDILVSKSGSIGTVVLVETEDEFSLFESLALIKFDQRRLTSEFFKLAVQNACSSLEEGDIKGVAVKHLHLNVLRSLRILVPPVEEQLRIVTRVTELRRLCTDLRQRLTAIRSTQSRLADALVESATV